MRPPGIRSPTVLVALPRALKTQSARKVVRKVTVVAFTPGKARGRPFKRGADPRRVGGSAHGGPDTPSPTAEEDATSVLQSAFTPRVTPRVLTGAERVRRVEGRELASLQSREQQLRD